MLTQVLPYFIEQGGQSWDNMDFPSEQTLDMLRRNMTLYQRNITDNEPYDKAEYKATQE